MAKKTTKKVVIAKAVVDAVHKGLDAAERAKAPLQAMGATVAAEYGNRKALEAIRSQFIADVILSMKRYAEQRKIILAPLGKKDTPEGIAIRDAKANARATVGMAFGLILKNAFPKEKTTQERQVNPGHAKIAALLTKAIKIAKGDPNPAYDRNEMIDGLQERLDALPKAIKPTKGESARRKVTTPKAPAKPKKARENKSTVPGTVGLGKPKQKTRNVVGAARKINAKKPRGMVTASDLLGAAA